MPEIQYTGYSFDIATLVVPFSESKTLCSIRTVPEVVVLLSLQSQLDHNDLKSYKQSQTQME